MVCETERGRHTEKDSINLDLTFGGGGQHLASCYDGFPSSVWEQIESLHLKYFPATPFFPAVRQLAKEKGSFLRNCAIPGSGSGLRLRSRRPC